ncbi:hypothetical protein HDV00_002792 [Rhizophlyctis rosea]|nr:hypothetical protein HDV00_002792 [Rhizophlyctis rosea]
MTWRHALSDERRALIRQRDREGHKRRLDALTEIQKMDRRRKDRERKRKWWDSLTDTRKIEVRQQRQARNREHWESLTEGQKTKTRQLIRERHNRWWSSLTDDKKKELAKRAWENRKKRQDLFTDEQKLQERDRHRERRSRWARGHYPVEVLRNFFRQVISAGKPYVQLCTSSTSLSTNTKSVITSLYGSLRRYDRKHTAKAAATLSYRVEGVTVSRKELTELAQHQGHCQITGLPVAWNRRKDTTSGEEWILGGSFDRIVSERVATDEEHQQIGVCGSKRVKILHSIDNLQVVCRAINYAKNVASNDQIAEWVDNIRNNAMLHEKLELTKEIDGYAGLGERGLASTMGADERRTSAQAMLGMVKEELEDGEELEASVGSL